MVSSLSSDEGDKKLPAKTANLFKESKDKKRSRTSVHDRKKSRKQKKSLEHEKAWNEYCKFMNMNLEKKKNYHESPHIVVNKSLHKIVENCIILKHPSVSKDNSLLWKIYYEIDKIIKSTRGRTPLSR